MELKSQLITACESYLQERITRIQAAIDDLQDALKLETKCSMGDKYETGRAMLHLEFEKLAGQMEEYKKLRKTLSLINSKKVAENVIFGTAVKTNAANYFVAIPAGEIKVGDTKFYAVGTNAPISKALMGKSKGEVAEFNGKKLKIQEIF